MKIRPKQMDVLDDYGRQSFEKRLAEHVRTHYAARPVGTSAGVFQVSELPMDCLLAMVRHSIERARGYGITWESAAAAYTALMFVVGPSFDEHPKIRRELLDPDVPNNSKMDHLGYVIPQSTWQEAKEAQGPQAWSVACPSLVFPRREEKRA